VSCVDVVFCTGGTVVAGGGGAGMDAGTEPTAGSGAGFGSSVDGAGIMARVCGT
jgi:hypothetical protein